MTKFKRFAALAAVMMLGIQILGAGTAFATPKPHGSADADCDFGSTDLEITLGDSSNVAIRVDSNGILQCDDTYSGSGNLTGVDDPLPVASVSSITVEMDHSDSLGKLYILLDDDAGASADAVAEWPAFDTFDIDVTTKVVIDGSAVDGTSGRSSMRVVVTASSLSFSGTTATSNAPAYNITGGPASDTIDASKSTAKITADGGAGADLIKGGSAADSLTDNNGTGADVIYGNGGNDDIDCGNGEGFTQGWGGDGLDDIKGCLTAAPGADDDVVDNTATTISYADLTDGIEWEDGATGGGAGDDTIGTAAAKLVGSAGDDVIYESRFLKVSGGAGDDLMKVAVGDDLTLGEGAYGGSGNDVIVAYDLPGTGGATANALFGGSGDDILKGKADNDTLRGGPGKDQAWGGSGSKDFCAAEVTNRCEYGKVA